MIEAGLRGERQQRRAEMLRLVAFCLQPGVADRRALATSMRVTAFT
jgi:hypothetical protein